MIVLILLALKPTSTLKIINKKKIKRIFQPKIKQKKADQMIDFFINYIKLILIRLILISLMKL